MTLVKLRKSAQLTLPTEIREALKLAEGDYLEAEIVPGGVLPRPVDVVRREAAGTPRRARRDAEVAKPPTSAGGNPDFWSRRLAIRRPGGS